MAEYIERNAMIKRLAVSPLLTYGIPVYVRNGILDLIEKQPAADVDPVRHGRWKYDNSVNFWKCSHCGVNAPLQGKFMQLKTKYCPSCGAKMDLEGGKDG